MRPSGGLIFEGGGGGYLFFLTGHIPDKLNRAHPRRDTPAGLEVVITVPIVRLRSV